MEFKVKNLAPEGTEKNPLNLHADLTTKLVKNKSVIFITFKNMTLTVKEIVGKKTTVIEDNKYSLGDMGKMRYCRLVKQYVSEGYELSGQTSNIDELLKDFKKYKMEAKEDVEDGN